MFVLGDGPSIIEENGASLYFFSIDPETDTHILLIGPILLLTMAEYFARNRLNISLEYVSHSAVLSHSRAFVSLHILSFLQSRF